METELFPKDRLGTSPLPSKRPEECTRQAWDDRAVAPALPPAWGSSGGTPARSAQWENAPCRDSPALVPWMIFVGSGSLRHARLMPRIHEVVGRQSAAHRI